MKRCRVCGGVYASILSDGVRYFHSCPPEIRVRVRRGSAVLEVSLADLRPNDEIPVRRDGAEVWIQQGTMQPGDEWLYRRDVPRENARDENVRIVGVDKNGVTITVPRAEGAGAEDVP